LPNAAPGVAKLRLAAAARADLADIDSYGALHFSDEAAAAYSRGFRRAFALLRKHPNSAPAREEYGEGVRCLVHRSHRILYVFDGEEVLIARVLHHSRDVKRALDE
jgi:toxin ParE1/3/4